jgi:hypothetical protein
LVKCKFLDLTFDLLNPYLRVSFKNPHLNRFSKEYLCNRACLEAGGDTSGRGRRWERVEEGEYSTNTLCKWM